MRKGLVFLSVIALLLAFSGDVFAKKQVLEAATPNLSFPVIITDVIEVFYQKVQVDTNGDGVIDENDDWVLAYDEYGELIPIEVEEVINDTYDGNYDGNEDAFFSAYVVDPVTGCAVDLNGDGVIDDLDKTMEDMTTWLQSMQPWYDQPVMMDAEAALDPNLIWNVDYIDTSDGGGANSWQADWIRETDTLVEIDFIDWGNPMENINPIVGHRFPVEVALYEKVADWVDGSGLGETSMTGYKMACLEFPGTKVELFGTSPDPAPDTGDETYESAFATVLTNKFFAEVWNPDGTITKINLGPGIGPSGKMNFASAGGGWIPTMPGWHRVWLHLNDPLITLSGAIVNNDEHYIISSGCKAQDLNKNKLGLSGIVGDSTFIDVLVLNPSGKRRK